MNELQLKLCKCCCARISSGSYCDGCMDGIAEEYAEQAEHEQSLSMAASERLFVYAMLALGVWVIYELTKGVFAQWFFERIVN